MMSTLMSKRAVATAADQFDDADELGDDEQASGVMRGTSNATKTGRTERSWDSPERNKRREVAEELSLGRPPMTANEKLAAALAATAPKKRTVTKYSPVLPAPQGTPEKPVSASETSTPGAASSTNPLDALASACLAQEEEMFHLKLTQGGTQVRADKISCTDVLCGRGGQSNHHPGNIFFRRLVRARQEEYLKANKREKTIVAKDIVKLIRMLTPSGRFLKKDPKDENMYVDVGDVQARNKASQALREGAPELREELRDQHNKKPGSLDVNLPYHVARNAYSDASGDSEEDDDRSPTWPERKELKAAAAAQGIILPTRVSPYEYGASYGREGEHGDGAGNRNGESSAALHAAEVERARRLMMAAAGPPGGAPFMNPHYGLNGYGGGAAYQHLLGGGGGSGSGSGSGPPMAAQLQALSAAGGGRMLSPQALMLAGFHPQQQQSAAAMLQASRAREFAGQYGGSDLSAYGGGFNPYMFRAQQQQQSNPQLQDALRLRELVNSAGNKREREEREREFDAKAAKLSRQYL